MRDAITQELKDRGFDEHGKLVGIEALERHNRGLGDALRKRTEFRLGGSLRFHIQGPLISAKYTVVRQETGVVIDALLQGVQAEVLGAHWPSMRPKNVQSQWNTSSSQTFTPRPPPSKSGKRRKAQTLYKL